VNYPRYKPDHKLPNYSRRPRRISEHKPDHKLPNYSRRPRRISEHKPRLGGGTRENDKIPDYKPYKKEGK